MTATLTVGAPPFQHAGSSEAGAALAPGMRPCLVCGAFPARRFVVGPLCAAHAPVVPVPDPSRDAVALRARYLRLVVRP